MATSTLYHSSPLGSSAGSPRSCLYMPRQQTFQPKADWRASFTDTTPPFSSTKPIILRQHNGVWLPRPSDNSAKSPNPQPPTEPQTPSTPPKAAKDIVTSSTKSRLSLGRVAKTLRCHVCLATVKEQHFHNHLFFGVVRCDLCDSVCGDCRSFERLNEEAELGYASCHHCFTFCEDPYEYLLPRMAGSDDFDVGGSLTLPHNLRVLQHYVNKLTTLHLQEPWSTAVRRCKSQLLKAQMAIQQKPSDDLGLRKDPPPNMDLPGGEDAIHNNTDLSGGREEQSGDLGGEIEEQSGGLSGENEKQSGDLSGESEELSGDLSGESEELSGDLSGESEELSGDLSGESEEPSGDLSGESEELSGYLSGESEELSGSVGAKPTYLRPARLASQEDLDTDDGVLLTQSYSLEHLEQAVEYVELEEQCRIATAQNMEDQLVSSKTKKRRKISEYRKLKAHRLTPHHKKKKTPMLPAFVEEIQEEEEEEESGLVKEQVELPEDGYYLMVRKAVEECPMCYEPLCPSICTVNIRNFLFTVCCPECGLMIYMVPELPDGLQIVTEDANGGVVAAHMKQAKSNKKIKKVYPRDFFAS